MSERFLYKRENNKYTDFNVWMAFPGIYSFSMSSLGYLWLCKIVDMMDGVRLERISSDTKTTEIMLKDVDMLGFSYSFELDFLNIFRILDKYNIPLKSCDRDESMPIVFGGGPVLTANPEPFWEFFDYIIIGDGENLNKKSIEVCKQNKGKPKSEILKELSMIDGIYVPTLPKKHVKKITCGLDGCIYTPLLSENSFFKDTLIMEIARGCSNRCGFCLASYLNLPLRFAEYETIELGLANTNKIAFLGALIAAHPRFEDLCDYILKKVEAGQEIEMSVSSLRADEISPKVVKTLVACGQKNATIAIEAGSERLRKVINKNLSYQQILKTVDIAEQYGLKGLKIYAMIDLPTETQKDLDEILEIGKILKNKHKGFDLTFAFSTFVPKPNTPFQWCGRDCTKKLEEKQNYLKKEFHKLGLKATFSSAKWDYYQSLLSRGGRELSEYVLNVYKQGGNIGAFRSAYRELFEAGKVPDSDHYTTRKFDFDEDLPWDFVELNPNKDFLKREFLRLMDFSKT